jgi:hypothetical protein
MDTPLSDIVLKHKIAQPQAMDTKVEAYITINGETKADVRVDPSARRNFAIRMASERGL